MFCYYGVGRHCILANASASYEDTEVAVEAVKIFHLKVLYSYHYEKTDVNELATLLKDLKEI